MPKANENPLGRARSEGANSSGSFSDSFLGSMNEELEESLELEDEDELPEIEMEGEYLSPGGKTQNVILEEASVDGPLPGMEKLYLPREEEWNYETAEFHGDYEDFVSSSAKGRESSRKTSEEQFQDQGLTGDELLNGLEDLYGGRSERSGEDYYEDDDTMAAVAAITGNAKPKESFEDYGEVDTDSAFDEVEEQEDDDLDLTNILAGLGGDGSTEGKKGEEEGYANSNGLIRTNFRLDEEDDEIMHGFDIDEIISLAIDRGASDVHIRPARRIGYRINGSIVRVNSFEPMSAEIALRIQQRIVTHVANDLFLEKWELDTSYTVKSGKHRGRRVRVVVTKGFEEVLMVMRIISENIPQIEDLEIEDEILEWSELPSGLVLMNGPTGTGKSTTLASVIQHRQMNFDGVIITIEKPIEYVYKDQGSAFVYQREVGRDTLSFSAALDSAMRMDPDVILIGEMRNQVEANAVIYAADTGHLSFSTTHANSTSSTVSRIKKMFEGGSERRQAMESLASVSRGFASQVLCKTVDGKGRFAVREILSVDLAIKDLIEQGDEQGIRKLQEERGSTLEHNLVRAVRAGRCTPEEARSKSIYPRYFEALLLEEPRNLMR